MPLNFNNSFPLDLIYLLFFYLLSTWNNEFLLYSISSFPSLIFFILMLKSYEIWYFPSLSENFFSFWHEIFQNHFGILLFQPWNLLFFQRALIPFKREYYLYTKICALTVLIATRYHCFYALSLIEVGHISTHVWTYTYTNAPTNICMNMHMSKYIYTNTYLYLFLYLSIKPWVHIDTSNSSTIAYHLSFSPTPFHILSLRRNLHFMILIWY